MLNVTGKSPHNISVTNQIFQILVDCSFLLFFQKSSLVKFWWNPRLFCHFLKNFLEKRQNIIGLFHHVLRTWTVNMCLKCTSSPSGRHVCVSVVRLLLRKQNCLGRSLLRVYGGIVCLWYVCMGVPSEPHDQNISKSVSLKSSFLQINCPLGYSWGLFINLRKKLEETERFEKKLKMKMSNIFTCISKHARLVSLRIDDETERECRVWGII